MKLSPLFLDAGSLKITECLKFVPKCEAGLLGSEEQEVEIADVSRSGCITGERAEAR